MLWTIIGILLVRWLARRRIPAVQSDGRMCPKEGSTLRRSRVLALSLSVLAALGLVVLAGCAGAPDGGTQTNGGGGSQTATETPSMQLEIVRQWALSRHALVVTAAAENDGCKNCHDGLTFTLTGGGFVPRREASASVAPTGTDASTPNLDEGGGESERDFAVATDCRACHTAIGAEIADSGSVEQIPSISVAEGGLGAVCMACHNGWHAAGKSPEGELTAPHTSVQTDMLYGVNTVDPGVESTATQGASESPHLKVPDTCVGCHVTGSGAEGPNHTFRIEEYKGCEREDCHDTEMRQGGTAKEDFDGDGTTETVAMEVEGLSEALKTAIEAKAGKFESSRGQVVFASKENPDDATYAAAYNYFYVQKDGSKGIHNTEFTVDLLRRSTSAVGGE